MRIKGDPIPIDCGDSSPLSTSEPASAPAFHASYCLGTPTGALKCFAILITLWLLVGTAAASVRSDIQRQYKRWSRAALVNDVDTILSVLAPDYTLHTYTGKVIARTDYEVSLRKRKASKAAATIYVTKMASISVAGHVAKVISDETSSNDTVDPITSKKLKMIHTHRYLDTWVKLGATWRLQTTITQVESTKVVPLTP